MEQIHSQDEHVDEYTLSLIELGVAGDAQLEAVRRHVVGCARCLRLVSAALAEAPYPPAAPEPVRLVIRTISRRVIGWLAFAACLVGVLFGGSYWRWRGGLDTGDVDAGFRVNSTQGGERGDGSQPAIRDAAGKYHVRPYDTIELPIRARRDGLAVVVLVTPDFWELLNGQVELVRGKLTVYHAIAAPATEAVLLLVCTDHPSPRPAIERALDYSPKGIAQTRELERRMLDVLRAEGHRWLPPIHEFPIDPAGATAPRPLP